MATIIAESLVSWAALGAKRARRHRRAMAKRFVLSYVHRNKNLKVLGFESYKEYLESEMWAKIRADRLGRFPDCMVCSSPADQVHHIDYDMRTLCGLDHRMLVTLCEACHTSIEFVDGKKVPLSQANERLCAAVERVGGKGGKRWARRIRNGLVRRQRRREREMRA